MITYVRNRRQRKLVRRDERSGLATNVNVSALLIHAVDIAGDLIPDLQRKQG